MRKFSIPLWVSPRADEPAHGLFLRLVERNGYAKVTQLENATGLRLLGLRYGIGAEQLAAIIRCEPISLMHSTAVREAKGYSCLRGERLPIETLAFLKKRRACPLCVSESAHHRFWFDLSFITTCPHHGVELVEACSCGKSLSWSDTSIVKCQECEAGNVVDIVRAANPSIFAMDCWALGKIGVGVPNFVLALGSMALPEAMYVFENVGALVIGGDRDGKLRPVLKDKSISEVRAAGFQIMQRGSLDELLDRQYSENLWRKETGPVRGARPEKFRNAYGWFGPWFKKWRQRKRISEKSAEFFIDTVLANASRKSLEY